MAVRLHSRRGQPGDGQRDGVVQVNQGKCMRIWRGGGEG